MLKKMATYELIVNVELSFEKMANSLGREPSVALQTDGAPQFTISPVRSACLPGGYSTVHCLEDHSVTGYISLPTTPLSHCCD